MAKSDDTIYRIYIDEVGNHDLASSKNDQERYLTLFGVWMTASEVTNKLQPEMREIKLHFFQEDPDEPIVFHRKEISKYQKCFSVLGNREVRDAFGNRMLQAYREWNYFCAAVTIDKREHLSKYSVWHYAPYHYCFEVLLERYVLFLHYRGLRGDVIAESRSTQADQNLQNSYKRFYKNGTHNVSALILQKCLTSGEMKLKKKEANICGLQLADLIAHSAHYDVLHHYGIIENQTSEYGREVAKILNECKYNRSTRYGKIEGYGVKLLY